MRLAKVRWQRKGRAGLDQLQQLVREGFLVADTRGLVVQGCRRH